MGGGKGFFKGKGKGFDKGFGKPGFGYDKGFGMSQSFSHGERTPSEGA